MGAAAILAADDDGRGDQHLYRQTASSSSRPALLRPGPGRPRRGVSRRGAAGWARTAPGHGGEAGCVKPNVFLFPNYFLIIS